MTYKIALTSEGDILIAGSTASPSSAYILPKSRITAFLTRPQRAALYRFRGLGNCAVSLLLSACAEIRRLSDDEREPTELQAYWPGLRLDAGIVVVAYSELPRHLVTDPSWQRRHGLDLIVGPSEVIACESSRKPDFRHVVVKALPSPSGIEPARPQTPNLTEIVDAIKAFKTRPRRRWDWS